MELVEIIVGKKAGCCFGVQRAIELAEKTRRETEGFVATLGPLIHNPRKVQELTDAGIASIQELAEVAAGTVIVRSHGAGPQLFQTAQERGIRIVDATCPFVRLEQELAVALREEGYRVVVVGDKNHPEVSTVTEWVNGEAIVISPAELTGPFDNVGSRIGVVCQTTQSPDGLNKVVAALLPHCREMKIHNTICSATVQRQQEVKELARAAERLVVIGGRDSANTRRLAEIGEAQGTITYLVESAAELDPAWFYGVQTVAVTAGASTPADQIQEVVHWLQCLKSGGIEGKLEREERMENEELKTGLSGQEENDFGALLNQAPQRLEEGMILKAKVVLVRDDAAYVDLGWKSDLPIPLAELTTQPGLTAKDVVKVGEEIYVMVIKSKDPEEPFVLSHRRAKQEQVWAEISDDYRQGATVNGRVTRAVKGGLEVEVQGIRAFLPASQVALEYVKDLQPFVGQELTCRIIELDPAKKRMILSRRSVLEEIKQQEEEKLYASLSEGQRLQGTVTRLVPFGVFVDLGGGVEGLVHLSELSWDRVREPKDVVAEGEKVEVLVLKIDRSAKRISLSIKQAKPHPWELAAQHYHEGDVVDGTVVRLTSFGAFVRLEPGIDGLIHISQLAHERVKDPKEVVQEGQNVRVKVISVDPASRRIGLSLKELTPPPAASPQSAGEKETTSEEEEVRSYLEQQETGELRSSLAELIKG